MDRNEILTRQIPNSNSQIFFVKLPCLARIKSQKTLIKTDLGLTPELLCIPARTMINL